MSIHTTYRFRHFRGGRLLWASGVGDLDAHPDDVADLLEDQPWQDNLLSQEGEQAMLSTFFRGVDEPVGFFFRLFGAQPTVDQGLDDLAGEVSGQGYAPLEVGRSLESWPTLDLQGSNYRTVSAIRTFEAVGDWTDATHLVLATTADNAGRFIAFAPLSQTRTLTEGDSLDVSFAVKVVQ